MVRANNGFCMVCRKNMNNIYYSYYYCSCFCSQLDYFRYKYGVRPQPMSRSIFFSKDNLEMKARESASHKEYFLSRDDENLSIP